ncbi:acylneuraminate cytidylyltransferase family protein [Marinobacter hydrocarbonoclasticus]|uniref:acylneuraminate cytidylyltransferase family protein n=1 Tax=Marinobacter nauticus TaxID=2743 RepID=UPI001A8DBA6E|nr:acylneuraminate cytidylyltransferase family protein [Marinobacter nauticus]MBN8238596.1 acylneuraminate cytidylyltransferase family protein [Marinobacter nauticus]
MKIAVIPARAGSKRLPGKNTKHLAGKPLIQWTIDAAISSGVFDRVFVSTESAHIAQVAKESGAEVPFMRPEELASDVSTTASVLANFLEMLERRERCSVEYVCLLQPTSPLRTAEDIRSADKLLTSENLDAVVSVCEMEHPIQLCNRLGPEKRLNGFIKPDDNRRAQDQEKFYRINGAIYFCRMPIALDLNDVYSDFLDTRAYIMSQQNSIDVDTELDFLIAQTIFQYRKIKI